MLISFIKAGKQGRRDLEVVVVKNESEKCGANPFTTFVFYFSVNLCIILANLSDIAVARADFARL